MAEQKVPPRFGCLTSATCPALSNTNPKLPSADLVLEPGVASEEAWHVRYASGEPILTHAGAGQGCFARIVAVPSRASALVALTNGADGPAVVDATFEWYLREVLRMEPDRLNHLPAPGNAASLVGEYRALTRSITVQAVEGDLLIAEVADTGPTWGGTDTYRLQFCEGDRLVSDRAAMEYGTLDDGRAWLRYRGRVHVRH